MGQSAPEINGLEAHLARASGTPGAWAKAAREDAASRLSKMGLPGRRDEYWRYTNPAPLTDVAPTAGSADAEGDVFQRVDRVEVVFENGVLRPDLSDPLAMEACEIESLATALSTDIHWASETFGKLEAAAQARVPRPLAALNTSIAGEGLLIRVSGNAAKPLAIRYTGDASADTAIRHTIRIAPGASLTLLESGAGAARANITTEIDVEEGGAFHLIRTQGLSNARHSATAIFARVAKEATFKAFTLTMGGVLTRNEAIVDITGDDATVHIAGAFAGGAKTHHDDTVFITHDAVNCESRQVFKKVLRDGATGVFQGKILVQPDAQKTDGYQISQGLLLDDDSQFLAKPELEIYADDVACSHGSTCGSVDETALFYLRSRGVPQREAEALLVLAFLAEALEEIEDESLRALLTERLDGWLAGA